MIKKLLRETMKKNRFKLFISLAIISVLYFSSCNRREVYFDFKDIKKMEWSRFDTLTFEIDSAAMKPNTAYNVFIEVVNNGNYPYRNIWFFVQDDFNDTIPQSDSKQYMIADEFGRWKGTGFGSLYQLSLTYKENVRVKDERSYTIKVVHGMRDEPLEGIEKLGIKIEKTFQ